VLEDIETLRKVLILLENLDRREIISLRFVKNKHFILLTVTVAILIIIGLSARKNSKINTVSNVVTVALSPFQEFINYLGDRVEGAAKYFQDIEALSQENEALKVRISELEKK